MPHTDERPGLLTLRPVLKRIRWGGRRLGSVLGKNIGPENDYAESWEVSCHPNGESVVETGSFAGRTLTELVHRFPAELLGENRRSDQFPILVKFLDAHDRLSVQVHPNDHDAQKFEPGANGKTEAWVILDSKPDSRLFVGLKNGVDRKTLKERLENGTVADTLHSYHVRPGDCVFIPAGTVHAIGEGILLAEVQQSSDITFRLHDWGRVGTDGQPRELHVEEALSCIDFDRGPVEPVQPRTISEDGPRGELMVESDYFVLRRYTAESSFSLPPIPSFRVLLTLQGSGEIQSGKDTLELSRGKTVLVPACCSRIDIRPTQGRSLQILEACLPEH